MSRATAALARAYDLHGIGILVSADEAAVIDAIDLRLRDFRVGDQAVWATQVMIAYVNDRTATAWPPGRGRRVYETPHGVLDYHPESDSLYGVFGGVTLRCNASRGTVVLACDAFAGRDLYLAIHPLTTVSLMELLERRGLFSLHAACLADPHTRDAVLLAGPSGAGKSTLALALARAGMSFLSDDIVFLDRAEELPVRVLGFADAVGLTPHAAEQFPELRRLLDEPPVDGFPKRLHHIEDLFGAAPLEACQPRLIVFPEVTPGPTELDWMDPREALLRLVPDVLVTDPASTQAHLAAIAALLDRVSCYSLRSGHELTRALDLVNQQLDGSRKREFAEQPTRPRR
jgi:hypothetical protein